MQSIKRCRQDLDANERIIHTPIAITQQRAGGPNSEWYQERYLEETAAKYLREFTEYVRDHDTHADTKAPPPNDVLLEEKLWKLHDVRCNYCSDLESYRHQLCENEFEDSDSTLKKALKNMSEFNLPMNAMKEMKNGFDSIMYKIIKEMLYEDGFCYCQKYADKDKCVDPPPYRGVNATYRAPEDLDYIVPKVDVQILRRECALYDSVWNQ